MALNKKDVKKLRERVSELTRRYEDNRVKIVQLQQQIVQLQQEVKRLLEVDHSLRGGLSELGRLLKGQAPEEAPQEEKEEEPDEI